MGLVGRPACFDGACPANHTRVIIYFGPGIVGGETVAARQMRCNSRQPRCNSQRALQSAPLDLGRPHHPTLHFPPPKPPSRTVLWRDWLESADRLWGQIFRPGGFGMLVAPSSLRRGLESPPPTALSKWGLRSIPVARSQAPDPCDQDRVLLSGQRPHFFCSLFCSLFSSEGFSPVDS
jgi:hypothetical protein